MEMVAHNPAAAKRVGVPQGVGRDFVAADQAKAKPATGNAQKLAAALLKHRTSQPGMG